MRAGPRDEIAAAAGRGGGELRASHADREQVIGTVKAAFVQGMLDKDEFDQRVGQAFAARTYAELAALTADLSVRPVTVPPPVPVRAQGEAPVLRPGRLLAAATALYAGVWVFTLLPSWPLDPDGDPPHAIIMLVFLTTLVYILVLAIAVGNMIGGWCEQRSGPARARASSPATAFREARRPR